KTSALGDVLWGFFFTSSETLFGSRDPKDKKLYKVDDFYFGGVARYSAFGDLKSISPTLGLNVGNYDMSAMTIDDWGTTLSATGTIWGQVRVGGQQYGRQVGHGPFLASVDLSKQRVNWFWAVEVAREGKGTHVQLMRGSKGVFVGYYLHSLRLSDKSLKSGEHLNSRKLWIAVLTSDGKVQALEMLRPDVSDGALHLDQLMLDAQDNIYLLGRTNHIVRQGTHRTSAGGRKSKFLVKLDANARWLWGTTFGSTSATEGRSSMILSPQGDIVVGAQTRRSFVVSQKQLPAFETHVVLLYFNSRDGSLRKFSPFDVNLNEQEELWVHTDGRGHLWMVGQHKQTLRFDDRDYSLKSIDPSMVHMFLLRHLIP
ncbi:MAG: hypothetical protein AAGJ35_03715, partial [Myxococcota bacterium]